MNNFKQILEGEKMNTGWYLVALNSLDSLAELSQGATYSAFAQANKISKRRVIQIVMRGFREMQRYDPVKRFAEIGFESFQQSSWQRFIFENSQEICDAVSRAKAAIIVPLTAPISAHTPVDALNISSRAHSFLRCHGFEMIGSLVSVTKEDLVKIYKFTPATFAEVIREIEGRGFTFPSIS
ncbi:DNA-directed RNA polymerase subunit alpha C-terminal domain-containing protein [Pseudomonas sp. AB12(2023)]|uniref:DNA-directed RNA polymerase subunit alpha C-terminal domain-containing protein n=1 Tax=Pseudomonas sp. AB12(2023) TaxID=3048597 RepID=UPI002B234B66|nr:DNA-directed RNA polymerase subunit alpha C-terminal domain-containing protein [Pseudomonas sp. AB12(2023)]MEB0222064.1 DNA-directed RNA polymerase subunit alpha C-terminal domain-containing protein [Pseudomonas sp. AB12(2023)]